MITIWTRIIGILIFSMNEELYNSVSSPSSPDNIHGGSSGLKEVCGVFNGWSVAENSPPDSLQLKKEQIFTSLCYVVHCLYKIKNTVADSP